MVMLVYPGENHSLGRKPNQIDLHRRIMQWFNHYLQGAPAPAWITEGTPHR
jgi:dipeptidyl aminopeptidase/acylaminoacyl peptidase